MLLLLFATSLANAGEYNHISFWKKPPDILICGKNQPDKNFVKSSLRYWENIGYKFGKIESTKKCPERPGDRYGKIVVTSKYFSSRQGETELIGYEDNRVAKEYIHYAIVELNQQVSLYKGENADTLTHEIGHAIGIPHVGNPCDIMYKYSEKC